MASFPDTTDLDALAAAMNEFAQAQEEYGGHDISVRPEDVTLVSGGSLTDADGNVYTLKPMTGPFADSPLADIYQNGNLLESGQFLGGGFWDAIRLVDGVVLGENGKGNGWFGPDLNGGDDPGPGDNAGGTVTEEPPVVTPPVAQEPPAQEPPAPVDTTENPPVTPPVDTASPPDDTASSTPDVVHAFFHHAHHGHEHRPSFISKETSDTTANVGSISPAVIASVGASVVADLTAAGITDIATAAKVLAAIGDDLLSHPVGTVDPSAAPSLSQLFAHCSHQ